MPRPPCRGRRLPRPLGVSVGLVLACLGLLVGAGVPAGAAAAVAAGVVPIAGLRVALPGGAPAAQGGPAAASRPAGWGIAPKGDVVPDGGRRCAPGGAGQDDGAVGRSAPCERGLAGPGRAAGQEPWPARDGRAVAPVRTAERTAPGPVELSVLRV
ncbi:hypothetical protein [Streptomyces sp. NRRL S-87]|uniref:hypothetical protein n=1 Tax=Streptomyces sp. NRRL S-87 TaxID=1463920 RepID=UPI0004BFF201|nr:hypothetical protein [Streptomyces sp. NRRL S-87]